jgi:hypothetical protein
MALTVGVGVKSPPVHRRIFHGLQENNLLPMSPIRWHHSSSRYGRIAATVMAVACGRLARSK